MLETIQGNKYVQHSPDERLFKLHLQPFLKKIKSKTPCGACGKTLVPILESAEVKMLLYSVMSGYKITTQSTNSIMSLQVIEGNIILNTIQDSIEMNTGHMLVRHGGVEHIIHAQRDSIILLTSVIN